jgi:1,4-alpha-glucan branching enzyme
LREVNATCYRLHPGIAMVAEESTAWPGVTRPVHLGGLGFGLKWNMGWMHDTLAYLARYPVHRGYHHDQITFSMIYAYSENYVLPLSHDEVVHGKGSLLRKMAGDEWQQFAGLRSLLAYMWAHPGKQLLFMGGELGQGDEWSADNGIQWHLLDYPSHQGVQRLVVDLNQAYARQPALWRQDARPEGFSWIDANDTAGNVLSFVRLAGESLAGAALGGESLAGAGLGGDILACVVNFSGMPHRNYRVGLPRAGRWRELINTDAAVYGGSGKGNLGAVTAVPKPWHGRPASASIVLPPMSVLWLTPEI